MNREELLRQELEKMGIKSEKDLNRAIRSTEEPDIAFFTEEKEDGDTENGGADL